MQNIKQLSPRNIWGRVVLWLREHHSVALHIACGDITDVEFDGDVYKINTTESFLYELLQSEDNYKDLKTAFANFGIEKFQVVKKDKKISKSQEDIAKLKPIFGNKLIIE